MSITNGVIYSDPLEINTAMTRLQYAGTVDLRGNVNARVTAQLLRNIWGVGPLISTFLWPVTKVFEYKVTGTLENPKKEPVYVPKFLLLPLHPHPHPRGFDSGRRQFVQSHKRAAGEMSRRPEGIFQNGQLMPTEK